MAKLSPGAVLQWELVMFTPWARRFSALIVLVALCGGVLMPLAGDLHAESDIICVDEAWGGTGHHQTTQIESVRPPEADGHCAVCHLQRAFGHVLDDAKRFVTTAEGAPWTVKVVARDTAESSRRDVPSRAPPARL
jgi:hypothetical protein